MELGIRIGLGKKRKGLESDLERDTGPGQVNINPSLAFPFENLGWIFKLSLACWLKIMAQARFNRVELKQAAHDLNKSIYHPLACTNLKTLYHPSAYINLKAFYSISFIHLCNS